MFVCRKFRQEKIWRVLALQVLAWLGHGYIISGFSIGIHHPSTITQCAMLAALAMLHNMIYASTYLSLVLLSGICGKFPVSI